MMYVYGIAHCSTVKKARQWLTDHGATHTFHDFKKQGAPAELLGPWVASVGLDALVNRRGTTWRQLSPTTQAALTQPDLALDVLVAQPSLIKRPVVRWPSGEISVGFDATRWIARL